MSIFLQDWRTDIKASIDASTEVWSEHPGADDLLLHGFLPGAILWPIASHLKEYNTSAIYAVREVVGENAEAVIRLVQTWNEDRAAAAHGLAVSYSENPELRTAVTQLCQFFEGEKLLLYSLAQIVQERHGGSQSVAIERLQGGMFTNVAGTQIINDPRITLVESSTDPRHWKDLEVLVKGMETTCDELLNRAPYEIKLGKEIRPDVVVPLANRLHKTRLGQRRMISATESLATIFEDSGGSLLVLGPPGSGKTTTMAQLAQIYLAHARRKGGDPVPVLLNLASWPNQRLPLGEWLVAEMQSSYEIPRAYGQYWVDKDVLIIILDGLDEVRSEYRSACVETIIEFRISNATVSTKANQMLQYTTRAGVASCTSVVSTWSA